MSREYRKVIQENIKLHKSEAYFYEVQHPGIFNFFEQRRIRKEVMKIKESLLTKTKTICLDLGSGTGNLARHLNSAGFEVIACDISYHMLKQNQTTHKVLCESNYLPIKNEACHVIATYSVFHHLPNVPQTLKEICRVASKSSILYFDSEPSTRKKRKRNRTVRLITQSPAYIVWLLTKPKFLKRFIEYIMCGRKSHLSYVQNVKFELTNGNPVNETQIIEVLRKNGFIIEMKRYGTGTLIKAKRQIVSQDESTQFA